jgi:hypothetical protein
LSKKIFGILLIATLAIVLTASLSYYAASQPNQTQNNLLTPTPTPEPTPTPTSTPSPSETPTEPASTPKPSVPEFTVRAIDKSYDVPTTTTTRTNFDGRKITTTTPGYHVKAGIIEISIKNQPFTPYYDSEGYPIKLYYQFRVRTNYDNVWRYFPYGPDLYFEADNSSYTTMAVGYGWHNWGGYTLKYKYGASTQVSSDGKIDFQVEAFIGHTNTTIVHHSAAPVIRSEDIIVKYVGQTSGWSETQTITIP